MTNSTVRPAALHDENNGNVPPGQRHHVRSLPRAAETSLHRSHLLSYRRLLSFLIAIHFFTPS
ncbi:hypothetical protein [uncultured Selenomonas sp.]|uniref:hypothetical protein n=1 Tax=uncultured Selenomonas sp. TaxID=159275 RepID=UPI0025E9A938|nr:hypothetical protein [uncultured Selenomonas sp.]